MGLGFGLGGGAVRLVDFSPGSDNQLSAPELSPLGGFVKGSIAYYRHPNDRISFRLVAEGHIRCLRQSGFSVSEMDLQFRRGDAAGRRPEEIAVVHPLFYYFNWNGLAFDDVIGLLKSRHRIVVGVEVAETTSISERFAAWADHPLVDGICLPSQSSVEAYRRSGVTKPLALVPHGVATHPPSARFDFLREDARPKVLCFMIQDLARKGWDLVVSLTERFPQILFVVKGPSIDDPEKMLLRPCDNILMINSWLSGPDLASLYHNVDCLLSLQRGGGFEMNCLEALAYGLPVIATGYGCVLDYLNADNAHLVKTTGFQKIFPEGHDHNGMGATADVEDASRLLSDVIRNLESEKSKARRSGPLTASRFGWEGVTQKMSEFLLEHQSRICL